MQFVWLLDTGVDRNGVTGFHGRTLLGRYDDDAVCRARSVDGCRRGVFQNLDRSDVRRVDHLQTVFHDEVVDHYERSRAGVERAASAYADFRSDSHFRGGVLDRDARETSLEGCCDVRCRNVEHILGVEFGDCAGQVRLALHAVADYDEFFDFDCGLLECGVESGLSLGHRNLKGFVSDKGEYEHGVFACDMDCIHTVGVGRGPGCSSFDQDGYAGYASRFVGDRAGYFTCLGLCLEALRQHCDGKCETYKYGFCHFVCF